MRWINIFHFLGILGCFPLFLKDWHLASIISIWIISSYLNSLSSHRVKLEKEELQRDRKDLIQKISKLETRAWEAEMKLATKKIE